MQDEAEFTAKFWKALKSDMTVMLEASDVDARPMTAQLDGDDGPIYFFTSADTDLAKALNGPTGSRFSFVSKGHDLFAHAHGTLSMDNDPEVIDRLWNRFVAAWFEKGKDDPKVRLLRFDAEHAEIWKDASSLMAGIKIFLGMDPKEEYRDKVADVALN